MKKTVTEEGEEMEDLSTLRDDKPKDEAEGLQQVKNLTHCGEAELQHVQHGEG